MGKKVLVPLDGSELAECALSHVRDLAKYGIVDEIALLTVLQTQTPWAEGYGEGFDIGALRDKNITAALRYLAGVAKGLAAEGFTVKTDVRESGSVAAAIADYAQKEGLDLIVVATNGYTGLKKVLMGSVAAGVAQQSNVPVYLIRPAACRV